MIQFFLFCCSVLVCFLLTLLVLSRLHLCSKQLPIESDICHSVLIYPDEGVFEAQVALTQMMYPPWCKTECRGS